MEIVTPSLLLSTFYLRFCSNYTCQKGERNQDYCFTDTAPYRRGFFQIFLIHFRLLSRKMHQNALIN